jgi:hypothetical protein
VAKWKYWPYIAKHRNDTRLGLLQGEAMTQPSELAERLLEHWRSTGMTLCVEAAAQIEAQRERIAQLDDEARVVTRRNVLLVIECDDLKARCNRLTHQLQELEAREQ